jgi:hypothetical protein
MSPIMRVWWSGGCRVERRDLLPEFDVAGLRVRFELHRSTTTAIDPTGLGSQGTFGIVAGWVVNEYTRVRDYRRDLLAWETRHIKGTEPRGTG